jgi:hypothetical protein
MTTETKHPSTEETPHEVDRIREIIFGTHMRAYEGNFQTIQRDLERLQQEIDHLNDALVEQEKNQKKKLQTLERELRETAQKLTAEKVDRQVLGDLLIELGGLLKSAGSFAGALKEMLASQED